MKNDNTIPNAIAATLNAMQQMIESAGKDVQDARERITSMGPDATIGAILSVPNNLKQALSLHDAVIAMHRFNRQEAP